MAIDSKRLGGIAYLAVDGKNYMLAGDLKYSPTRYTRETMTGQDRVHGFSEKPHPGFIECSVRDAGGLSVADIGMMRNVTVTLELANGKTVVGRNMWVTDAQEVDTMEAKMTVRFEGEEGCVEEVSA